MEEVEIRSIWPNEAADFSPWLAANLPALGEALGKYAYHLPLARHAKQMHREGLEITSQTLWDQP